MMRFEPRQEDPNVNIVLLSGITTGDDKGKQPEESVWVRKAPAKEPYFVEDSTLGSKYQLEPRMDPSMLTTFLETCMKLLRDSKTVKGLQELITRCAASREPRVVQKLGNHTMRTGREMRLTVKIGEYEMDQVILDLGSDANVLPK